MTNFSKNLQFIRESKGLGNKEFGKLIGVPGKQVSFFEEGFSEPDLPALVSMADALQVSIDKLLRGDMRSELEKKEKIKIKLLVLDIDGVLTDGGMYFSSTGESFKKFNVKDGRAIRSLTRNGATVGFLSGGNFPDIIQNRAEMLGVQLVATGTETKLEVLKGWQKELKLKPEEIACIGDDINDLEMIKYCGFSACPADAVAAIKEAANVTLTKDGGEGCVREFVEAYLEEVE